MAKMTRKQLRQIIQEAVDRSSAEAAAEEALVVLGMPSNPQYRDLARDMLASKLLEQPELVQQLAVAMAGGHKAIRQFLENLGILGE
tara:strand:- start:5731 stop:5991 length:261 start_codon:yes stop_codon:yes gene_type:complete